MLDFPFQDGVGLEANHVTISFFLQPTVQGRVGKGRIATKELRNIQVAIPIQFSTSALDLSQGLGVLVFMQDEWEQLDVNCIRVTAIPGLCIFGGNISYNTDDLDTLYEVFNMSSPLKLVQEE